MAVYKARICQWWNKIITNKPFVFHLCQPCSFQRWSSEDTSILSPEKLKSPKIVWWILCFLIVANCNNVTKGQGLQTQKEMEPLECVCATGHKARIWWIHTPSMTKSEVEIIEKPDVSFYQLPQQILWLVCDPGCTTCFVCVCAVLCMHANLLLPLMFEPHFVAACINVSFYMFVLHLLKNWKRFNLFSKDWGRCVIDGKRASPPELALLQFKLGHAENMQHAGKTKQNRFIVLN